MGASVGGKRRADTLAPKRRSAIAAAAAKARWDAYYAAHPEKKKAAKTKAPGGAKGK